MKVLWISPNGGRYDINNSGSGGWIASLESAILDSTDNIELYITFISNKKDIKKNGRVTYIPIFSKNRNKFEKFISHHFNNFNRLENNMVSRFVDVINFYKPDIVHIWGCESFYIKILSHIRIPHIVHIQGVASGIINYYLPPFFSARDIASADGFIKRHILNSGDYYFYKYFSHRVEEEIKYSKSIKYWLGRTEWDRIASFSLNQNSQYFHCDELMREEIQNLTWSYSFNGCYKIVSIVGETWYKGLDQILKCSNILNQHEIDFEWIVCGINKNSKLLSYFSRKLGINYDKNRIKCVGFVSSHEIKNYLLNSDVYVHPSHIENSSNAICEAMELGVPVVAEFVGGNPSILKDNSGILVQPYDARAMVYAIQQMSNKDIANAFSYKSLIISKQRHNKEKVLSDLISAYKTVIELEGK